MRGVASLLGAVDPGLLALAGGAVGAKVRAGRRRPSPIVASSAGLVGAQFRQLRPTPVHTAGASARVSVRPFSSWSIACASRIPVKKSVRLSTASVVPSTRYQGPAVRDGGDDRPDAFTPACHVPERRALAAASSQARSKLSAPSGNSPGYRTDVTKTRLWAGPAAGAAASRSAGDGSAGSPGVTSAGSSSGAASRGAPASPFGTSTSDGATVHAKAKQARVSGAASVRTKGVGRMADGRRPRGHDVNGAKP